MSDEKIGRPSPRVRPEDLVGYATGYIIGLGLTSPDEITQSDRDHLVSVLLGTLEIRWDNPYADSGGGSWWR